MVTRRFAQLITTLAFAMALALSFAPAAHAQPASTQAYWCWGNYYGWYPCGW
jgi:hypothetical protein